MKQGQNLLVQKNHQKFEFLFTEQTRLEKCLDRILLHPVDSADFITSPGIQTRRMVVIS